VPIEHEQMPAYDGDEAAFHREVDERENDETTPPKNERVGRPAVMLAECFVGGDLERLTAGLSRLGLREASLFGANDYFAWADGVRRGSSSGSWTRAGSFYRVDTERRWMGDRPAQMPEDFDRISLRAHAPTPAVVVLTAVFELAFDAASALDDELRTRRYLRLERSGNLTHFLSARHRKLDALATERSRVLASAQSWLEANLPGTLIEDFGGRDVPAVEFITTRLAVPTEVDDKGDAESRADRFNGYCGLLGLDTDLDAWESERLRGWRLIEPSMRQSTVGRRTLLLWSTEDPGFQYTGQESSRRSEVTLDPNATPKFQDFFGPLLVRWALVRLVEAYEESLAQLRDTLTGSGHGQVRRLSRATEIIASTSFDASIVGREVADLAQRDRAWMWDVLPFAPASEWRRDHGELDFMVLVGQRTAERCEWVVDLESRLRDQIIATTNLQAAKRNLALQYQVLGLTVISAIIAVLTMLR